MWFAGAGAGRHAVQEPDREPASGRRSVQDHRVGAEPAVRAREERELSRTSDPDIPPGNVDKITAQDRQDAQRQAQDVISGKLDYMQDPPPADIKPEVKAKYSDRYEEITTASTYYFFMNTRVAPFDDPKVREAVNCGIDKPGARAPVRGRARAWLLVPAARHAGLRRGARRRGLPVGRPERAARPREGAADDQGRRRGRHGRDRLRQQRRPDRQGHRGVRRHAQRRWASTPSRRSSTAASTSRRSATRRRRPRPASPTGSRTSRTRRTSCSSWTASRFSRRTTRTTGTWTTRRSPRGSPSSNQEPELTDEVAEQWEDLNSKLVERALDRPLRPPQARDVRLRADGLRELHAVPPGLLQRLLELLPQVGR